MGFFHCRPGLLDAALISVLFYLVYPSTWSCLHQRCECLPNIYLGLMECYLGRWRCSGVILHPSIQQCLMFDLSPFLLDSPGCAALCRSFFFSRSVWHRPGYYLRDCFAHSTLFACFLISLQLILHNVGSRCYCGGMIMMRSWCAVDMTAIEAREAASFETSIAFELFLVLNLIFNLWTFPNSSMQLL